VIEESEAPGWPITSSLGGAKVFLKNSTLMYIFFDILAPIARDNNATNNNHHKIASSFGSY
jgi:hypothetical protein